MPKLKKKKPTITLLRSGNNIVLDPTTPKVFDLVTPQLQYTEIRHFHGYEALKRKRLKLPKVEEVQWDCFSEDVKHRIATSSGFQDRIEAALRESGYPVRRAWATEEERVAQESRRATVFKARWDRIDEHLKTGFKFRHKQREALKVLEEFDCGRIDCPPGWGKGTVITLGCMLFPKAKIAVVTKRVPVMLQRLYPELCTNLPDVGIVGGGKRDKGHRVMCYTADSLHHATGDEDIVFVDEGHEACSDSFAGKLGVFTRARVFMFSASWDLRLDNKDMRAEAMAGPIRLSVTYKEAEEHGMVVPIRVKWSDVIMDHNPASNTTGIDKKKSGIWQNEFRNKVIARDARRYDKDTQVLITVETLEHAMELKRFLPEYKIIYSGTGLKDSELDWFRKQYPDTFKDMTQERKKKLTRMYEQGKLKKAIATTVWNVGVNFRHLEVLIRADAGGSPINDTQIPGRTSRTNDAVAKADGTSVKKHVGIVHDYKDQFDYGFSLKAKGRQKSYDRNEWEQIQPSPAERTKLRQEMGWGEG